MKGVAGAVVVAVLAGFLVMAPRAEAATTGLITSSGPISKIEISKDLNCAVDYAGDSHGEFFDDTACGTFVAVGNTVYGPATIPAGPRDGSTSGYKKFTTVSQTTVTGNGSVATPYKVTTVVKAGTTNIQLTQTDTYVTGQQSYRTDVQVDNKGLSAQSVVLYRAGDCYLANDDRGFGVVDTTSGAVSCVGASGSGGGHVPNSRIEQWTPISSGSKYFESLFSSVWSAVLSRSPFTNTCQCSTFQDNGAGLSWQFSVGALGNATKSHLLTFSPIPMNPLATTKTADSAQVAPGGTNGYTISLQNPNALGATITSVTDDLPAGFTYQPGSTTGVTTADPVVTNNGRHLQWNGTFATAGNATASLHFRVTAATTPGDYLNNAGGSASGNVAVTPTGDTALVRVLGPASLNITAAESAVREGPTTVPTADVPLQPNSPAAKAAGLLNLNLLNSGLLNLNLLNSGLLNLNLLNSGLLNLNLLNSGLLNLNLLNSGLLNLNLLNSGLLNLNLLNSALGFDSLVDPQDLGGSPLVKQGLARLPLTSLVIRSGDDWPKRFAGTPLADRPLTTITFGDVLAALPASKVPTFNQLDLSVGALGQVTSVAMFMGDTRLTAIRTVNWCSEFERLGYADCGAALGVPGSADKGKSASVLSLAIAGVPLDQISGFSLVTFGDVTFATGQQVMTDVLLTSIDLYNSSIGGMLAKNVAAALDCAKVDCTDTSTKTLYDAARAGAVKPGATIATLGSAINFMPIVEAVVGMIQGASTENALNAAPAELGVLGYGGSNPTDVHYTVTFTTPTALANPTLTVTLPAQFSFIPGSSAVTLNGASFPNAPTPVADHGTVSWNFANSSFPASSPVVVTFTARPGLTIGSFNASAVVAAGTFSLNATTPTPIAVAENFETGDSAASATPIQTGSLYFGQISHAGDRDYYTVAVPAGQRINAYLTQGDVDADLVVYHPASSRQHASMRPPADVPAITATPDRQLSLANQGEPLDPAALNDIQLLDLPIAGISGNRQLASDSIETIAWDAPAGAVYTIQVSGYNGASGVGAYALRVATTPSLFPLPSGTARVLPHDQDATIDTPANPSAWSGTKTLVIADRQRLRRAYGDSRAQIALDAIGRLEGAGIGVRTLYVDAYPDVNAAFADLDARPSDVERSNDVVRAINARVDSVLGANRAGLENIVLVGTDEVLPMGRVPDLTATANERSFAQELLGLANSSGGNNALLSAAAAGMILTDDPFGSFHPAPFLGTYLYTPDVALGRLVETPEEMRAVIDQFLTPAQSGDAPGVLRPQRSVVTGYDFMTNMAKEIRDTLNATVTPGQVTSLINENWSRSDLVSVFPGASPVPDIISANAHYSPFALLPPSASDGLFTPSSFGGPNASSLARRTLFEMGCHSGFSISDFLTSSGNTGDWPQAMLGRGAAAFIGNTGFGIGLESGEVGFSARLTADIARNIATMPLGTSVAQAKRDYLSNGTPNVYDYKIMSQATYYGLPMFHLPGATQTPQPPAPRPTINDATTGLTSVDISTSQPVTSSAWELVDNGNGKYWQLAPNRLLSIAQNNPIQPKLTFDVTQPGLTARGAFLTRLQSVSQNNFDPALAQVAAGPSAKNERGFGEIIYPSAQQQIAHSTIGGQNRDTLILIPGHFESQATSSQQVSGTQTRFTKMDARVFFSNATDHVPPTFDSALVQKNGATASFKVVAHDPNGGTVTDVTVLFTDGSSNDWTFRHLTKAADGSWVGGFSATGQTVQFLAQAVDAAGNVGLTTNKGNFFEFANHPAGQQDVQAGVTGEGANGWFADGAAVTLTGQPDTMFSVTDNGGSPVVYGSGQPIAVTGAGVHTLHYVATNDGASGDVTVGIDKILPTITAGPTTTPNAAGWYRGPVTVHFDCSDAESGIDTCEPDRTVSNDGTGQSVTGRATDKVGNANTATVGGINIDTTPPSLSGAATTPANANGWYNGPVTVRFTCSDDRAGIASCPADQTISSEGTNQSVTGVATDAAGNQTAYTVSGINIDTTAPLLTGSPTAPSNAAGWYNGSVTIRFACADGAGSGVATCAPNQTVSGNGANQSVTATVVDRAGNPATTTVAGINIDTAAPTITGTRAPNPNSYGWYNAPVVVNFSCNDTLSGVAFCQDPITIGTEGTNQSVTGMAIDTAGNGSSATVTGINIDRTAPTISATPNDTTWRKGSVTVHFTCADDRSGIASCPADVVVTASGIAAVSGTATDKAGNTKTVTVNVRVDNDPPSSAFDGSGLIIVGSGGTIRGTATDSYSGVDKVVVTFRNNLSGLTSNATATVTCAEPRTNCTWTAKAPSILGTYKATSVATDRVGNAQNPGTVRDLQIISL